MSVVFFFKQKTAYEMRISDWSSDVCSSDLREHVIVLSDWTFLHPHQLVTKLKAEGGYFNRQKQTVFGMLRGGPEESMSASDRAMWGKMRMDPADIADVTAATYTYLVNGHGPQENWTGLFRPGERVRLRIINAATMSRSEEHTSAHQSLMRISY